MTASGSPASTRRPMPPGSPTHIIERIVRPDGEVRHRASNGEVMMGPDAVARPDARHLPRRHRAHPGRPRSGRRSRPASESLVESAPDAILGLDATTRSSAQRSERARCSGETPGSTASRDPAEAGRTTHPDGRVAHRHRRSPPRARRDHGAARHDDRRELTPSWRSSSGTPDLAWPSEAMASRLRRGPPASTAGARDQRQRGPRSRGCVVRPRPGAGASSAALPRPDPLSRRAP